MISVRDQSTMDAFALCIQYDVIQFNWIETHMQNAAEIKRNQMRDLETVMVTYLWWK